MKSASVLTVFSVFCIQCTNSGSDKSALSALSIFRASRVTVSGTALKGEIRNGSVTVSSLLSDGTCSSSPLASGTTDDLGRYSISYPKTGSQICITVSSKSDGSTKVYDEKSGSELSSSATEKISITNIISEASAVKSGKKSDLYLSPFSRILSERVKALRAESGTSSDMDKIIRRAGREAVIRFGLSKSFSGKSLSKALVDSDYPELNDLSFSDTSREETKKFYSMLAGFSYLANKNKKGSKVAVSDLDTVISAFASDFSDGVMDGKTGSGTAVTLGGASLGTNPITNVLQPAILSFLSEGGTVGTGSTNISVSSSAAGAFQFNDSTAITYTESLQSASAAAVAQPVPLNIKNNMTLEFRTVFGTADASVSSVEYSIDSGTYQTATGTSSWKFTLPTGTSSLKRDTKHSLSIRAKDSAGNISPAVTFNIILGRNKDFNGDGYPDIAVGGTSGTPKITVYKGGPNYTSITSSASADQTYTGSAANYFGYLMEYGDFNGDGFGDLIITEDGNGAASKGKISIYNGSASGLNASASGVINYETVNYNLGRQVTSGDFNGDGFDDIAVTAAANGLVYIFYGTAGSFGTISASAASRILTGAHTTFGAGLAAGDLDGDGYSDLAVGEMGFSANQGRVYIYYGSASGLGAGQDAILNTGSTYQLGVSLHMAHTNNDSYSDLVAGAMSNFGGAGGRVFVFNGSSTRLSGITFAPNFTLNGPGFNQLFGTSVYTGDFNCDGLQDLIVGGNTTTREVYIFHSTNGFSGYSFSSFTNKFSGGGGFEFGSSVLATDMNSDGCSEAIMGENAFNTNAGRLMIQKGSPAGITGTFASPDFVISGGAGEYFGFTRR